MKLKYENKSWVKKKRSSGFVWSVKFWDSENHIYIERCTSVKVTGSEGGKKKAEKRAKEIFDELSKNEESKPETMLLLPYLESFWTDESCLMRKPRNVVDV